MRYRYLDFVRAAAALSVLIWHYQHFYYPRAGVHMQPEMRSLQPLYDLLWPFYLHGGQAVEFFWVLSGFVFAATYISRKPRARDYLVRRFARLYPLHFATLIIVALLQAWSWKSVGHFQIYVENDAYHFALNTLFIQWWGFQKDFSFNAPTWSVSAEIAIYICFFISIPLMNRSAALGSAVGIGAAVLLIAIFSHNAIAKCGLFFYLGTACWALLQRTTRGSLVIGTAALVGFFIVRWFAHGELSLIEMILLFAGIILMVAAADAIAPIRHARLDWVGNITYGTYLLHVPIQIALITASQVVGRHDVPFRDSPLLLIAYILVTVGCAATVHRLFEQPANLWLRQRLCSAPKIIVTGSSGDRSAFRA